MNEIAARRRSRQRAEDGFSLLEMLIAMVILALILAFLPGAFRLVRQVWTATAVLDRDSGRDAGLNFLETRLSEAMPLFEPGQAGLVNILFKGTPTSLRFVAPSRNGPVGGGLYSYTLELRERQTGGIRSLMIVVAPYFGPPAKGTDPPAGEEQVLADDVSSAEFRYFGRHELRQAAAWRSEWKRTDALPDLVELSIVRIRAGSPTNRTIITELRLRNTS
jgi:prepilin-type N-terminal cleavage/methylation domain-containing protein